MDHFPRDRGENKKRLKPPPRFLQFFKDRIDLSHEKIPPTFHYTGWLIGILTTVYYN